ncbi:MAG: helix-turn-helix transcriptional regulator [Candidatus Hadarchaeum sp.]|uniref:helix-turn-helix transcriptional regulator n=1 Tax=Candidatus Hadarchaeum sp. TaxID=2883567 RepID=UPI003D12E3AD
MVTSRDSTTIPLDKKVLMINEILISDCSLLLYSSGVNVWQSFGSFIDSGLANGETCLYAYDESSNKLQLETIFGEYLSSGRLLRFPLGRGYLPKEIEELGEKLKELCAKSRSEKCPARVLVDFGGLITRHSFDKAFGLLKEVMARKEESFTLPQERKKQPVLRTAIVAFNLESLNEGEIKALLETSQNVMISTNDGTTTLALNFRYRQRIPELELAPKESLEHFVKRHLETIVLSMLTEHPMCGYDVIKTIYQRYYTSLSQGTVYSLLYSMEARGLVTVMKTESQRSKLYVLTKRGRELAESRIKEFITAQRYLLESIQKPG